MSLVKISAIVSSIDDVTGRIRIQRTFSAEAGNFMSEGVLTSTEAGTALIVSSSLTPVRWLFLINLGQTNAIVRVDNADLYSLVGMNKLWIKPGQVASKIKLVSVTDDTYVYYLAFGG